jgi:YHS domain-containing protein
MRRFLAIALSVGALAVTGGALAPTPAFAAKPETYTGLIGRTAVGGYDPVAYFTQGKPVKGDGKFTVTCRGATWRFASADNLAKFKANPAAYAPQYGGYCAWAVAQGYTASGDPRNWKIVDGKLYLNYNDDIQARWEKNIPGFIASANKNWPRVLSK